MTFSEWFRRMYVDEEFRAAYVADKELEEWQYREMWPKGLKFRTNA